MDKVSFHRKLQTIKNLDAQTILSSHLPPAENMTNELVSHLYDAIAAPEFIGPDQAALEAMMAA